jgi:hypothetical protein
VHETDLHLEPNEASDLCPVEPPGLLAQRGWDRAFVTVLDEAHAEGALALLGHDAGAEPGEGWHAERIHLEPASGTGKTQDAEACARRAGHVYMLGSQFGSKAGPLNPSRSWVACVPEAALGDRDAPMGIRALHTEGDDVFDAVVGDLDAAGKGATILADHPAGGRAASRHVRFSLPRAAGGGAVQVDTVHEFGSIKRVEGIAVAPDGHAHYVIDEEGHVALRTLLLE